jgi:tetratricopeptide (TPR) repeat protein
VTPTLIDYAGLPARTTMGRSLRRAAAGEKLSDEPAYSESLHPQLQYGWAPLFAWRTAKHKLIEAPRPELYDLEADAAEQKDAAARDPQRLEAMRRELSRVMAEATTPSAETAVDAETKERLAALGYVGSAGGAPPVVTGKDPKDGIGLVTRLGRNGMTVARTEPEKAIRELTALLEEDPGMLVALRTRAVAFAAAGRHADAVRDLRELEKKGALSAEDAVVLGDNLRLGGHVKEASAVLEKTIRANPTFAQPLLSLAAVHVEQRDLAAASAAYTKVLELEPDNPELCAAWATWPWCRAMRLKRERATRGSSSSTRRTSPRLTKLGVVKVRTGAPAEAIRLLQRAVELDPRNAEALLYLAGALAASGRASDACRSSSAGSPSGPAATMVLNGLGLTRLSLGDRGGAARRFASR